MCLEAVSEIDAVEKVAWNEKEPSPVGMAEI
jgi:hypothetical protein